MEYRFNEQATSVIQRAETAARISDHSVIEADHLLIGILLEPASTARRVLDLAGVDAAELGYGIFGNTPVRIDSDPAGPSWSRTTRKIMRRAFFEAFSMDKRLIGTEHLLLGILSVKDDRSASALSRNGLDLAQAEEYVRALAGDPLVVAQQELTTAPAVEAVRRAVERSVLMRADALEDEHLLWALGQIHASNAAAVLTACHQRSSVRPMTIVSGVRGPVPDARHLIEIIRKADFWAQKLEHRHVGSEHLLLALLCNKSSSAKKLLRVLDVGPIELQQLVSEQVAEAGPEARFRRPEVDVTLAGQWFSRFSGTVIPTTPGGP